jgi:hypothetical protein
MSKNTHLEHLEDSILIDGTAGAKDAFVFLDDLARSFSGNTSSSFTVTTKWDGAPAIFCGLYPGTNSFFVGTKSVFNKDAKINYTNEDIERNHGHAPGLVKKLKDALKYLPALGIKGVAQGDLLFTDDKGTDIINGVSNITFKPNTITYSVAQGDALYNKVKQAKIGVVFHTFYEGRSIEFLSAKFGFDISKLKEHNDILVLSAETGELGNDTLLTQGEKNTLIGLKQRSTRLVNSASPFLDIVSEQIKANDQLTVGPKLKVFFNKYIRDAVAVPAGNLFVKQFTDYFEGELGKAVGKLKTPKAKAAKLQKMYDGLDIIEKNQSSLASAVDLYKIIQNSKSIFIKKLEKGERFGTYLRTEDGLEMTSPEGYVIIRDGTHARKLVERARFSAANFKKDTLPTKKWVEGDAK